jgi:hypothetical protein
MVSFTMSQSLRSAVTFFALLLAADPAVCEIQEKPATNMRDVQMHFKTCLTPFHEADGSQINVYFSVKRDGQIFGRPRAVWYAANSDGQDHNGQDHKSILADFLRAFRSCTPLHLDAEVAAGIPGKVYFLQFKGSAAGPQVIVRPYGSEGPPLIGDWYWW